MISSVMTFRLNLRNALSIDSFGLTVMNAILFSHPLSVRILMFETKKDSTEWTA